MYHKVRVHCHYTKTYRGTAHSICNLRCKTNLNLNFIDSFRFMSNSLSIFVDNLSEGLHNKQCIKCNSFLEYLSIDDKKLTCKCIDCNKNYKLHVDKDLIKRFANTYEFCNKDIYKFSLSLRKGNYPYKYMDSWEIFEKKSLSDKKEFYSSLNMEDITDVECKPAKKVWKDFKINNLDDYHNLYVQSDTLLLADVFENFRNKCIEIYEFDPAHFISARRLA